MDDKTNEVLSILQEECAEVIQAVSKINRFGLSSEFQGLSNRERLVNELGDVMAMIYCLIEVVDFVKEEEVILASDRKVEKLKQWSNIFKD